MQAIVGRAQAAAVGPRSFFCEYPSSEKIQKSKAISPILIPLANPSRLHQDGIVKSASETVFWNALQEPCVARRARQKKFWPLLYAMILTLPLMEAHHQKQGADTHD